MEQRAKDLVGRMTLEEKAAQMVNTAPSIPRLGVPAYDFWSEGLHGIARSGYATLFPQAIGMAATFDEPLLGSIGEVVSVEARAKYNEAVKHDIHSIYYGLTIWSPNINIFRDPRWGRGQETYGEDPFLTARLGTAFVKGIQGDDPKYFRAIATPQRVRSISSVEWASGLMLNWQPSSSPRACQRQSRSSRHGLALISTATPWLAQAARIASMSTS
jgi:beta-glucosidase